MSDLFSPLSSSAAALVARDLVRTPPGRTSPVLDGVDLVAGPGTRVGLIGENGSGKTTLLRLLAGVDEPDAGSVSAPADLVLLAQEVGDPASAADRDRTPPRTVGALLEASLRPLREAVERLERLAERLAEGDALEPAEAARLADRYDASLAWAQQHEAWDAPRRTAVTAAALGVGDLDPRRPLTALSGGQRTRLGLTAALVRRPACLLLDEPTNHLDAEALEIVESALVELPGIVVAASHDRAFLDRVCTDIVDLDAGALGTDGAGGRHFGGGFSAYLAAQAAARERWRQTWRRQQDEIERLRQLTAIDASAIAPDRGPRDNDKFIHRFKGAGVERTRARRQRDAERRLEVAERGALPAPPEPLRFAVPALEAGAALRVRDLVAGDPLRPRLRLARADAAPGEHLLVTGPNGAGKTTLLHAVAAAARGRADGADVAAIAVAGTIEVRARRARLMPQDPRFARPDLGAGAVYRRAVGAERAEAVPLRTLGLLHGRDLRTPVHEPTNHLSLALVAELVEAVEASAATVVATSHDRWLRERWRGARLELGG